MDYTGERMLPEASDPDTFWEHIFRYAFAARFAPGRRVVDVACGAGYGSAALGAAGARQVIGIDVAAETCDFARQHYGVDARLGDAQAMPLSDQSCDLVVSYETIEHLPQPLKLLDECVRVLDRGGVAIISTPHRAQYRKITPNNPYHLHEFERDEFVRECHARFPRVSLFSQRPLSAPWWSWRGLATESWAPLTWPGVRRIRNRLRRDLHPEFQEPGLNAARRDPVASIVALSHSRRRLVNPYAIRSEAGLLWDDPIYLLAVCTKE